MFPVVPFARVANLQAEAAVRAVPLPAAPGTLTLGVAASVTGVQVSVFLMSFSWHFMANIS